MSSPRPVSTAAADRRRFALLALALVLLTAYVFGRVVGYRFVMFDDDTNIAYNPQLGGLDWAGLRWMFTDVTTMHRYLPFGWLAFFAVFAAGGLAPAYYHAAALLGHAVNAVLVFAACRQALRVWLGREEPAASVRHDLAAALAAGLWTCHPLRAETVGWASGLLYVCAATPAIVAWMLFVAAEASPPRQRRWQLAVALVLFGISLLTYPLALGLPFVVFAWSVLRAPEPRRVAWRPAAAFAVVSALAVAAQVAARFAPGGTNEFNPPTTAWHPFEQFAKVAYVLCCYVWRVVWPARLSPVYDTLIEVDPTRPAFVLSMIAVVVFTACAILVRRRWPWLLVGWLAYAAFMLPYSGLLERTAYASDRYDYVIGVWQTMALAMALALLLRRWPGVAVVAATAALATAAVAATRQVQIWRDTPTLYAHIDRGLSVPSVRGWYRLRYALILIEEGKPDAARAQQASAMAIGAREGFLTQSVAELLDVYRMTGIAPYAILHQLYGLERAHRHDAAGADAHFTAALAMQPGLVEARYNRAISRAAAGDPRAALADYFWLPRQGVTAERRRTLLLTIAASARAQGDHRLADAAGTLAGKWAAESAPAGGR